MRPSDSLAELTAFWACSVKLEPAELPEPPSDSFTLSVFSDRKFLASWPYSLAAAVLVYDGQELVHTVRHAAGLVLALLAQVAGLVLALLGVLAGLVREVAGLVLSLLSVGRHVRLLLVGCYMLKKGPLL